jgi:UDP:flavonoid glycosyltransferase YjiC (YdhE family)
LEQGNFLKILSQMAAESQRAALAMAEGALAACRGVDLIVAGIGGLFSGIALGEKLDLPVLQAYYIPFTPTRTYPSFLFPRYPGWLGPLFNVPSFWVAQQVMWQSFRPADKRARLELLDLPPAPLFGPYRSNVLLRDPVLYAYSPHVIPKPPDWGPEIQVTGYWFLEDAEGLHERGWEPSPALQAFLNAGSEPVFIGFGSMTSRDPAQMAELILEALTEIGQRAVLLSGWGGMQGVDLPETVHQVDSIPFSWLFPRVAAVVHHGGAGTTAAGLRAGVPSLVVPFFGDQPYWGARIADLGVGPKPIPRKTLTADRLAAAIQQAIGDEDMRVRAAEIGTRIRVEDGVGRAVALIQEIKL